MCVHGAKLHNCTNSFNIVWTLSLYRCKSCFKHDRYLARISLHCYMARILIGASLFWQMFLLRNSFPPTFTWGTKALVSCGWLPISWASYCSLQKGIFFYFFTILFCHKITKTLTSFSKFCKINQRRCNYCVSELIRFYIYKPFNFAYIVPVL